MDHHCEELVLGWATSEDGVQAHVTVLLHVKVEVYLTCSPIFLQILPLSHESSVLQYQVLWQCDKLSLFGMDLVLLFTDNTVFLDSLHLCVDVQ